MQSGVDVGAGAGAGEDILDVDEDNIPSAGTSTTSLVTPRTERFSRRVSGVPISGRLVRYIYLRLSTPTERMFRTEQRFTDFSITRLGRTCVQHPNVSSHGALHHFTPSLHSLSPRSAAAHPLASDPRSR
jgi:hypothetical protein